MITSKVTNNLTYFLVEADCENNCCETVSRYLGVYQGMSDNGSPAWTAWGPATQFLNLESAVQAATHPYQLSSYDSHYRGGDIRIRKVTETIVTTKSVEMVYVIGENIN